MLHRRNLWWVVLLALVLVSLSTSAALAQSGTNGGKTVLGGMYVLPSGQTLNGNLTVMGGTARVESGSTVNGSVTMMGGTLEVAGRVRGNIGMLGGTLNLTDTAVVDGNVSGLGGSVRRAAGAVVRGSTQGLQQAPFVAPVQPFRSDVVPQQSGRGVLGWFLDLMLRLFRATGLGILLALVGAVVLLFAPRYTGQVATTVAAQPALNFATGLLTLVLAFLVSIPLMIACGLGLLVWLAAFLVLLFGWIAVGLWVGQRLLEGLHVRGASSVAEVAVGVFLITWLAWILPCLGWLFGLVLGSIGVGAVLLTRFGTQPASGLGGLNWSSGPSGSGGGLRRAAPPAESTGRAAEYTVPPAAPEAPPARTETSPDVARMRSLEDLEAVDGITAELATRLRAAGSTTLVAVATSDPATLAYQAGVNPERVRDEDWIGQARRLLG